MSPLYFSPFYPSRHSTLLYFTSAATLLCFILPQPPLYFALFYLSRHSTLLYFTSAATLLCFILPASLPYGSNSKVTQYWEEYLNGPTCWCRGCPNWVEGRIFCRTWSLPILKWNTAFFNIVKENFISEKLKGNA